jgi:CheY-like chemotaxis protein
VSALVAFPSRPVPAEIPDVSLLAHDLNNVLGGILGLAALVARDPSLSPAQGRRLEELRRTAERGADLVAQLHVHARAHRRIGSEPGAGTSFEILLQRANETTGPDSTHAPAGVPRTAACPREAGGPAPRTPGTVLLVEDDEVLRATYGELLADEGWEVIAAGDGFNALLQAGSHRGRIDLLVSDIILPQMSGIELWRKLSSFRPESRVLFVSGNLEQARQLLGRGEEAPRLLGKPFTATALLEAVRAILAQSPFLPPEPPARA